MIGGPPLSGLLPHHVQHGTSHMTVVDAAGNCVSVTTTVNLFFGSRVQSPSTGLLWNDEMDDFSQPGRSNAFGTAVLWLSRHR